MHGSLARASYNYLRAAFFAFISLAKLTHSTLYLSKQLQTGRLFFNFHRLAATGHGTVSAAGYNDFRSTLGAFIALTYLVCHRSLPFIPSMKNVIFLFINDNIYNSISLRSGATRSFGSVTD